MTKPRVPHSDGIFYFRIFRTVGRNLESPNATEFHAENKI